MLSIFKNIYHYVIVTLFLLIISYLCYLSYLQTCYVSIQYATDVSFFLKDNLLGNIVFTVLFIFTIYLFSKNKFINKIIKKINTNDKVFIAIKWIMLLLIGAFSFLWIYLGQILPEGDQALILEGVYALHNGNFAPFERGAYLERFPNQWGIMLIYYLVSFIFKNKFIFSLQLLNVISVVLIYKNLSEIAKFLKASYFIQLLIIFTAFTFPILMIYCWFIYGNLLSMAFILCSIKYELYYFNDYKIKNAFLSSIFLLIALLSKSFSMVYLIAMIIYALFKSINIKSIKTISVIILYLLTFLFQNAFPKLYLQYRTGYPFDEGVSYISYIAMGMQEGPRAEGWHNKYNINTYYEVDMKTTAQKELVICDIKQSMENFVDNPSYAYKFYSRKTASQWNNPTFEAFYGMDIEDDQGYHYRYESSYSLNHYLDGVLNLKFETKIQEVLNIEQSIILFGCLLYIVLKGNKTFEDLLLPLAFVGGFLFLLLWEAKSQYTLYFYPTLFIYSILGYKELLYMDRNKFKVLIFYLVITFSLFALTMEKSLVIDNTKYDEYVSYGNSYEWFRNNKWFVWER